MSAPRLHLDARWHSDALGVVSIVHGAGEHSGRYEGLRDALAAGRFSTAVLDLRGHGRSSGRRLDVERFDEYQQDFEVLRNLVASKQAGLPHFLIGHSMGTLVVLNAIERATAGIAGAVLMSAALRPGGTFGRIAAKCAAAIAVIAPKIRLPLPLGFGRRELTSDPVERSKVRRDQLVETWATLRWGVALSDAMAAAISNAPTIKVPILFMHGSEDHIADLSAARDTFERATSGDKTFLTYAGARHELFAEVPAVRAQVVEDLLRWLTARATARDQIEPAKAGGPEEGGPEAGGPPFLIRAPWSVE
jgi:alpha-beta hydrolase superfamily lysophospholipase